VIIKVTGLLTHLLFLIAQDQFLTNCGNGLTNSVSVCVAVSILWLIPLLVSWCLVFVRVSKEFGCFVPYSKN